MKIQTAILVFSCVSAIAQDSLTSGGNFIGTGGGSYAEDIARQKAYQEKLKHDFVPKDPWRAIDGKTNYAKLGWDQFIGTVVAVKPYGIWVKGGYGEAPFYGNWNMSKNGGIEFFIKNYPYQSAYGDDLLQSQNLTAKESGFFTFTNTTGGSTTLHQLDYGVPCGVPPELIEQIKAQAEAKAAALKKQKEESDKSAIKWLLPQATNGDASAQCDLGERYLKGQGVETNKETAVYWLTQAANQGDVEASNMLAKLKVP